MLLLEASSLPLIRSSDTIFIFIIYTLLGLLHQYVPMIMRTLTKCQRTNPFVSVRISPYAYFLKACLLCYCSLCGIAKSR